MITDQTGVVVQRFSYTPFGSFVQAPTDGSAIHHYFTGKELDASTSLYYFGARYYDPALGRFTQPDPLVQDAYDPQTLNPYTYVRNNPLRLVDPNGESFQDAWNQFKNQAQQAWNQFVSSTSQAMNNIDSMMADSFNAAATFAMQAFTSASFSSLITQFNSVMGQAFLGLAGFGLDPLDDFTKMKEFKMDPYSIKIDEMNKMELLNSKRNIHGTNMSMDVGLNASAFEWSTTSAFSKGTAALDSMSASGRFGAVKGELGAAFDLSAHVLKASSEFKVGTIGGTSWSIATEAGWGVSVKVTAIAGRTGGRVGMSGGLGPTAGMEIRFRNEDRWKE